MNPAAASRNETILEAAIACARECGKVIATRSGTNLNVQLKHRVDLVTDVDVEIENRIKAFVNTNFPDHLVIGEESSQLLQQERQASLESIAGDGICWVIDPVDGTTNFVNAVPASSVSIGILVEGERTIGVVYDPFQDELFHAVKGSGAFLNGAQIHCSQKSTLLDCVVGTGFPYDRYEKWDQYRDAFERVLLGSRDLRRLGSASIDQCWVAMGRFDAFFEYNLKPWDIAAGSLIVEEAGGKVTNFASADKDFSIFSNSYSCSGASVFSEFQRTLEG